MDTHEQHTYLTYLIKELENNQDKSLVADFTKVAKHILKVRADLHDILDYPIWPQQYDELITFAENLLGVNRFGSANDPHYDEVLSRTDGATSADGASEVDQDLVKYSLDYYTPDQLTFDLLDTDPNINAATKKAIKEALLKKREEYDDYFLNAETIAALEEAMNEDPKNFKNWDQVRKELLGDDNDPNYKRYWGNGQDAHWFYSDEFELAWKCADIWHSEIYYWPYNEQIIVGKINRVEWYKTKGDELEWGPIFGPFESPDRLGEWVEKFWKWWHALSDEDKVVYHNIPTMDNQWHLWNTDYIEMFRKYAAIKSEYDYNKIAAEAQNDEYSKMTEEDYMKRYYNAPPKAFTKEWNEKVADLVGQIKTIESNFEERNNEFDGEIIHDLEQKLLNLLKQTL